MASRRGRLRRRRCGGGSGDELYDQAVAVVLRDKKVSTSYIQRRLQIGYNKAASLIERMEKEGLISAANATGKREILVPGRQRPGLTCERQNSPVCCIMSGER